MIKEVLQEIVCDECKKTSIVINTSNKNETLKKHGWKVKENPPMCKGMDMHLCPNCSKEQKILTIEKENIKLEVQKGFWVNVL
jgi:hypothetical protein